MWRGRVYATGVALLVAWCAVLGGGVRADHVAPLPEDLSLVDLSMSLPADLSDAPEGVTLEDVTRLHAAAGTEADEAIEEARHESMLMETDTILATNGASKWDASVPEIHLKTVHDPVDAALLATDTLLAATTNNEVSDANTMPLETVDHLDHPRASLTAELTPPHALLAALPGTSKLAIFEGEEDPQQAAFIALQNEAAAKAAAQAQTQNQAHSTASTEAHSTAHAEVTVDGAAESDADAATLTEAEVAAGVVTMAELKQMMELEGMTQAEIDAYMEHLGDATLDTSAAAESVVDAETDADNESEQENDTEAEDDTESENETESESEAESESEDSAESDADADVDADADSEADSEEEHLSMVEAETEADSNADSDADTESEVDAEAETESETASDEESPAESEEQLGAKAAAHSEAEESTEKAASADSNEHAATPTPATAAALKSKITPLRSHAFMQRRARAGRTNANAAKALKGKHAMVSSPVQGGYSLPQFQTPQQQHAEEAAASPFAMMETSSRSRSRARMLNPRDAGAAFNPAAVQLGPSNDVYGHAPMTGVEYLQLQQAQPLPQAPPTMAQLNVQYQNQASTWLPPPPIGSAQEVPRLVVGFGGLQPNPTAGPYRGQYGMAAGGVNLQADPLPPQQQTAFVQY